MAEVWQAVDVLLGRTVAVKVVHPQLARQEEFVRRFLREARLSARLDHASILPIYDVSFDGSRPFLVTPLLSGGSLGDALSRGKPARRTVLAWLGAVASALDFAHSASVVHRDVKPANVLFDAAGKPFLTDFGIAKCLEDDSGLTTTGAIVGTPAYISPEQVLGEEATPASDQYSLGVLGYRSLAGRLPFEGASTATLLHKTVYEDVPPPSAFDPALARCVDEVFARALAKRPGERFPSCVTLVDALERATSAPRFSVARGEPVSPGPHRSSQAPPDPAPDTRGRPAPDESPKPEVALVRAAGQDDSLILSPITLSAGPTRRRIWLSLALVAGLGGLWAVRRETAAAISMGFRELTFTTRGARLGASAETAPPEETPPAADADRSQGLSVARPGTARASRPVAVPPDARAFSLSVGPATASSFPKADLVSAAGSLILVVEYESPPDMPGDWDGLERVSSMTNLSRGGLTLGPEDRPDWSGYRLAEGRVAGSKISFVVDPSDYHPERVRVGDRVEIRSGKLARIPEFRQAVVVR